MPINKDKLATSRIGCNCGDGLVQREQKVTALTTSTSTYSTAVSTPYLYMHGPVSERESRIMSEMAFHQDNPDFHVIIIHYFSDLTHLTF